MWAILKLLGPFKEIILIGSLIAVGWFGWDAYIDSKTDNKILQRNNELLLESIEETKKVVKQMEQLAVELTERERQDAQETENIINDFRSSTGSNDSSGIDGRFVR